MISQARIVDRSIVVHSRRLLERSAEAGIRVDRASVELYSGPSHSDANADACPPTFGPVPAHYGNAPFRLKAIEARQMNIGR